MACLEHMTSYLRELEKLADVARDLNPQGSGRGTTLGQVTFQTLRTEDARARMYRCLDCWRAYHQLIGDDESPTRPLAL